MTPLPTRPLGTSGLEITTVGFGSWAVGGGGWAFGWGPQDDARSVEAIARAVDLGVNWVDTAAVYGLGHGEEVVGRAVRALPAGSRPLVFTKCGLDWDDADRMKPARRVVTPASVRRGAEDSLRRLGLDRVDLFQIHWPDDHGNPDRAGVERDAEAARRGPGSRRRCLQLRRRAARALRGARARRLRSSRRSTSSTATPPRSLLPWAEEHGTGRHLLQPDEERDPDGLVQRRTRGADGRGRLAQVGAQLPRAGAGPQPVAARRPAAHRRTPRHDGRRRRRRLDARLAGRHRRDRRRPRARAGGRLDRRGGPGADGRRPRRDRGGVRATGAGSGPADPRR